MTIRRDGRIYQPELAVLARPLSVGSASSSSAAVSTSTAISTSTAMSGDSRRGIELCAPAVGWWRGGPAPGALVRPGDSLGELEMLGVLYALVVPQGAYGVVIESGEHAGLARRPVSHGERLLILDPDAGGHAASESALGNAAARPGASTLVFRTPMSGRYFSRPGPDKPAFVQVGGLIRAGATVCLLEVMKTFNRVTYGGQGLPEVARVKAVVPRDEEDLAAGDVILELEPELE